MSEHDPQRLIMQISAEVALPPDEVLSRQQRIIDALRAAGVPKIEITVSSDSGEHETEAGLLMSVDEALDKVDYPRTRQHNAVRRALYDQGARTLRELLAFGQGIVSGLDNVGPRTLPFLAQALASELPDIPWLDQPTPADVAELYGRIEDVPSRVLGKYSSVLGWPISRLATAEIQEIVDAQRNDMSILNPGRHARRQREVAQRFVESFHAAKANKANRPADSAE